MTEMHGVQCIDGQDFQSVCEFCLNPLNGRPDFMCAGCREEWIRATRAMRSNIRLVDQPVQFTTVKRGRQ